MKKYEVATVFITASDNSKKELAVRVHKNGLLEFNDSPLFVSADFEKKGIVLPIPNLPTSDYSDEEIKLALTIDNPRVSVCEADRKKVNAFLAGETLPMTRAEAFEVYQRLHEQEDANADYYLQYAHGKIDELPEHLQEAPTRESVSEVITMYDSEWHLHGDYYSCTSLSETFWADWRENKIAMKALGFIVEKGEKRKWSASIDAEDVMKKVTVEMTNTYSPNSAEDFDLDALKFDFMHHGVMETTIEIENNREHLERLGFKFSRNSRGITYLRLPKNYSLKWDDARRHLLPHALTGDQKREVKPNGNIVPVND